MLADVVIVVLLVMAVIAGVFRGAIRQFISLGAWLICLVVAAHLRPPIADYLIAQEPDFSRPYANMVAFVVVFVVLFVLAVLVIQLGGRTVQLTSRPLVDEMVGGVAALLLGVLAVSGLEIALDSYFAIGGAGPTAEIQELRTIHVELEKSIIGGVQHDTLAPTIKTLLGPLLPADVHGPD